MRALAVLPKFAAMKHIGTIVSVYLLVLALLPCADQAGWCNVDVPPEVETIIADVGEHDHHSNEEDHCSPLCICSCCHITLRTPLRAGFAIAMPKPDLFEPPALQTILTDLTDARDIWEPPKRV